MSCPFMVLENAGKNPVAAVFAEFYPVRRSFVANQLYFGNLTADYSSAPLGPGATDPYVNSSNSNYPGEPT